MSNLSRKLIEKLRTIANGVNSDKRLHFFGLVHVVSAPPDRWDLLVSAEGLVPWSIDAIKFVVERLQRELSEEEIIQVNQVVALPPDNKLIKALTQYDGTPLPKILGLHPMDVPDNFEVIWPLKDSTQHAVKA